MSTALFTTGDLDLMQDRVEDIMNAYPLLQGRPSYGAIVSIAAFILTEGLIPNEATVTMLYNFHVWTMTGSTR